MSYIKSLLENPEILDDPIFNPRPKLPDPLPADSVIFKVDVSRTYKDKTGYAAGGYRLNTSFETEHHTPQSFLENVVKEGWPYTMAFYKRSPEETGAKAKRNVSTAKHTENYHSRQELTLDDDSQAPDVIDFWLNDWFFSRYGLAFVESANSKPTAQKGHPTFIFDRPLTDPALYQEAAKAAIWHYRKAGRRGLDAGTHNIDRTWYNAAAATVHYIGAVCPWDAFELAILQPYRQHKEQKRQAAEALRLQAAPRRTVPATTDRLQTYVESSINGILNFVATRRETERHHSILWAGNKIGSLEAAEWVDPLQLAGITNDIIAAVRQTGAPYSDQEILRVFNDGRRWGQMRPAEQPDSLPVATVAPQKPVKELMQYQLPESAKDRRARVKEAERLRKRLLPLVFSDDIPATEYDDCDQGDDHVIWSFHSGRGVTKFFCNDVHKCQRCRDSEIRKLEFLLDEASKRAYVDATGNAAWATPYQNADGEWVHDSPGPGVWYAKLLTFDERRKFVERYRYHKPGGYPRPELYPVTDGGRNKYVALSLAPFEDMQPLEITNGLLAKIVLGATGTRSGLLFAPAKGHLERRLPEFTFQVPEYLHTRGIVETVKAPYGILFTGPVSKDDIDTTIDTRAETFDDILTILDEIGARTVSQQHLHELCAVPPDYVIQCIHILPEAKQAYLETYNAGRAGDLTSVNRHRLKPVSVDNGISLINNTMPLMTDSGPPPEASEYMKWFWQGFSDRIEEIKRQNEATKAQELAPVLR